MFNRKYIFKWSIFHVILALRGGNPTKKWKTNMLIWSWHWRIFSHLKVTIINNHLQPHKPKRDDSPKYSKKSKTPKWPKKSPTNKQKMCPIWQFEFPTPLGMSLFFFCLTTPLSSPPVLHHQDPLHPSPRQGRGDCWVGFPLLSANVFHLTTGISYRHSKNPTCWQVTQWRAMRCNAVAMFTPFISESSY